MLNRNRLALTVLAYCEKEAYSTTGMEHNFRLFVKSRVEVE